MINGDRSRCTPQNRRHLIEKIYDYIQANKLKMDGLSLKDWDQPALLKWTSFLAKMCILCPIDAFQAMMKK